MTATIVAALFGARRVGPGLWQARCPAHDDRNPSLRITEGKDGQHTLLRYWAGCTTESVLIAAGLGWSALFTGPPPANVQTIRTAHELDVRERGRRQWHVAHVLACDRALRLESIACELASRLARMPDDAPDANHMAKLYHSVLERVRDAETAIDALEAR